MQLIGKVMTGNVTTFSNKQGGKVDKTRLRILDQGDEAANELMAYWVDFLGDASLTDAQLQHITHQEVTIELRKVYASIYNGKSYLNLTGGIILFNGNPVQEKLVDAFLRRNK
jgi:hypothetical protein